MALNGLLKNRAVKRNPLTGAVAAISVGVVNGVEMLDLCYEEDRYAAVDMQ